MENYYLNGPEIKIKPPVVYRYISDGTRLFQSTIGMLRASGSNFYADHLDDLLNKARTGRNGHSWHEVVKFVTSNGVWTAIAHKDLILCKRPRMFVTFDLDPPSLRDGHLRLCAALGLWKSSNQHPCFLEVKLHVNGMDRLKFPTFADAGWFRFFRSAPLGSNHGLTKPHPSPDAPGPQPEAVMKTVTFARLPTADCVRYVVP